MKAMADAIPARRNFFIIGPRCGAVQYRSDEAFMRDSGCQQAE
jgi:hypothetical protein